MTRRHEPVREIDLLAYADGLLDADVARREEVERYLAAHPQAADYVAEIKAQNDAIRAQFGSFPDDPLPDRLAAALHSSPRPPYRKFALQAAAVAALVLVSSAGGWWVGQSDLNQQWALDDFVERAASTHNAAPAALATPTSGNAEALQPLGWLNQRIVLELATPDLADAGFNLVAKNRLGTKDDAIVRLLYERADGATINLFLRPRWEDSGSRMAKTDAENVTVQYWLDGPLAFAMTTDAAESEADHLVGIVRQAVGRARLNEELPAMALTPESPTPVKNGVDSDRILMPGSRPPAAPLANDTPQLQVN